MELIIILGIVLGVVVLLKIVASHNSKSQANTYISSNIHSKEYRHDIYNNTSTQHQESIRYLYDRLDVLERVLSQNNARLNTQATHIAAEVLEKAQNAEKDIKYHWTRNKTNADFYFYIGLHYTSFTLADKLTEELNALREYSKILTNLIDSTQNQIDPLKKIIVYQPTRSDIGRIKSEHRELCKKCDALRKTREVCNNQISLTKTRRDTQNEITRQRRDYIGTHFGSKGRTWHAKIISKHKRK